MCRLRAARQQQHAREPAGASTVSDRCQCWGSSHRSYGRLVWCGRQGQQADACTGGLEGGLRAVGEIRKAANTKSSMSFCRLQMKLLLVSSLTCSSSSPHCMSLGTHVGVLFDMLCTGLELLGIVEDAWRRPTVREQTGRQADSQRSREYERKRDRHLELLGVVEDALSD